MAGVMRQRRTQLEEERGAARQRPLAERFAANFRRFDVYAKLEDDYRVQTRAGGTVSLVGAAIIALLFLSESYQYLFPARRDEITVDTSLNEKMTISLNITFPALTCAQVSLDAMDVSGDQQLRIEHAVYKERIDKEGRRIGERFKDEINSDAKETEKLPDDYCGSCFGAKPDGECCNTCDEVIAAYSERGWGTDHLHRQAEQCIREQRDPSARARPGEGCLLHGSLEVNKVSGNFHITPGRSSTRENRHVHQFSPEEALTFNSSHIIHSMTFGDTYPGQVNPLDGMARAPETGTALYQYYIKVVTTEYEGGGGRSLRTNQYSVTEKVTHLDPSRGMHAIPGVFFIYEPSPFLVKVSETRQPLTHFLTNACAIVGGAFTIAGLIDSFLFHLGVKK